MSLHAKWAAFRYIRRNVETGVARYAERGFISRLEFIGQLAEWSRQQPDRWQYEACEPVLPVAYVHDLYAVIDRGPA